MSKNTDLGALINYIKGQVTGRLNAPAYTSATAFTGTIAGYLGFDTSGNILTSAGVGFTGSGTTNYIPKFTGSTALGNSLIYDSGTNIGINNTNPLTKLHVIAGDASSSGRIRLTHGSGTAQIELYTEPSGLATIISTNALSFETGGSERMRISSTGNVGIGITAPTQKLVVSNGASTNYLQIIGQSRNMYLGQDSTGAIIYSDGNVPMYFSTDGSERMRITADGGLNINTSTTGYTLNAIASTSTQFNAVYKGSGSLVNIMARFMGNTSSNIGIAIGYESSVVSGIWATQAGVLMLGVLSGTTYKSKLRIDTTTVAIDIPTSSSGLASGQMWNDGGYVRIT